MGVRIAKYAFIPKENEQIDTVITLEEDVRSMIHGVVKDSRGRYVKDAVVKLFRAVNNENQCELKPITHMFTDECGQFMFGPLTPGKKYVVKVWVNEVKPCKAEEEYPVEEFGQKESGERIEIIQNCGCAKAYNTPGTRYSTY